VTEASSTLRNYKIRRHHTKISRPVDLAPGIFSPEICIFNFTKTQNFCWYQQCNCCTLTWTWL